MNDDAPVKERLARVRDRIEKACRRSGRSADSVTLVGASKTQGPALLAEAWEAGLRVFGENRVQEAVAKSRELPAPILDIEWHLIGPLQSNKVRPAVELFRAVHSIDRPRIAEALDREAAACGKAIDGFLEINLGGEESKHGFVPEGLADAVRPLAGLSHLRIAGLMAIPPPGEAPEDSRPWFRKLRELRDDLAGRPEWQGFPGWLSMGMSDDFEVAVEEGATHVRVGSALFGPRRAP
ncbi:MAG TPA: YggS family pyridoxal phosphate-dependent enzyme [Thermoanaerobaculia bacterium]|jgi:pyridoxal phosphate enzyme (YggS family)|nr:YggS family pyridoxal phosphate-dependent enzyme [Thermoanaerobaculia bacterium]